MIVKRARVSRLLTSCRKTNLEKKRPLKMIAGSFYIPKKNDQKPLGEDSHFICLDKYTIGVADGVGGWSKHGIDSGKYATLLMSNSMIALIYELKNNVNPTRVLQEAYKRTQADGSSTACIITLKNRTLRSANVGDSGFMVFRDKKLMYRSRFQQHSFNCPYQLGLSKSSDDPSVVDEMKVPVKAGDLVIAGTDGLFDNIWPSEIEEILCEVADDSVVPEQLARSIAETASYNSRDESYESPFEEAANFAGRRHIGGKVDDVTVVVGKIVS